MLRRSTKKVKTKSNNGGEAVGKEIVMVESLPSPPSHEERLLRAVNEDVHDEAWLDSIEDMDLPDEKWYKEVEDDTTHD